LQFKQWTLKRLENIVFINRMELMVIYQNYLKEIRVFKVEIHQFIQFDQVDNLFNQYKETNWLNKYIQRNNLKWIEIKIVK
jgi:hypothetical protein